MIVASRRPLLPLFALLVLGLAGCPQKPDDSKSTAAKDDKSEKGDKGSGKKKKDKKGDDDGDDDKGKPARRKDTLADDGNDKAVVKAVKKALAGCKDKWDDKKGFGDCEAPLKEFRDSKFEKSDATFLDLLEDESLQVRWFGDLGLGNFGYDYRSEKKLAQQLIQRTKDETAPSILDAHLAYLVSGINESTKTWDDIQAMALDSKTSKDVRAVLGAWWNGDEKGYAVVQKLAGSKDKALRLAGIQGYALHFDKHGEDACKAWDEHLEDEDKDVRVSAVGHLTGGWSGNSTHDSDGDWYVTGGGGGPSGFGGEAWCPAALVDDALAKTEARVGSNTVDEDNYVYGLAAIVKVKLSTPAQKKKAEALLEKIVDTKGAAQRSFALSKLVEVDPSKKGWAMKYAKDDELKWTVDNIMKQHK
ncbi:MAG: hypothetical protein NVSMB47_04350 [Polyangiales bacterium]